MSELKNLQEKRNSLLTKLQTIATHKDGWNSDRRSQFDKINAEVTTLEADIQRAQTLETYDTEQRQFTRSPRPGTVSDGFGTSGDEQRDRINKAFRSYARTGQIAEEHRNLLTTSDATGGALIPQIFSGILVDALKYSGPIATKVRQKVTNNSGAPLKVSLDSDVANGITLLATEGTSSPVETDPTFVSRILNVDTVTGGLVKVSFQELEDSSFSLDTFLRDKFATRYARGIETAITTGRDSSGTVLPSFTTGGLLGAATVGTTTATLAGGIGWTDLVNTFAALDPAYTVNPSWVMNSTTRSYLIGLKDGFGKPYFLGDPSSSAPFNNIMGYEIVLDQAMPNIGAGTTPNLFGSLNDAWLHRSDGEPSILRLDQRYADQLMVGFFLWSRIGGLSLALPGTQPIVSLKIAAS